jgi:tetratricopeptide (TPR) repeat protein
MAKSALIEELEKQFNESPRRVFARLANEYRKSGDLELAIEICRTHIPQQPSYISGYIVLGQALFESQMHEEAQSTFETALGLDPENLIALRQLGDIARVQGDSETARAWYHRLLEVDPQNEEAATQLANLKPAEPAPSPRADSGSSGDEFGWREIHPEDQSPSTAESTIVTPAVSAPAIETLPSWMSPDATPTEPQSDAVAEHEPIDVDEDLAAAASAATVEMPTFEAPDAGADAEDALELPELELPPPAEYRADEERAVEVEETVGEDESESDRQHEIPATFVTETMAELYLQQGFTGEALAIYRQLLQQRPEDAALRRKIESLEPRTAPEDEPIAASASSGRETIRQLFTRIARMRAPEQAVGVAVADSAPSEPREEDDDLAGIDMVAIAPTQPPGPHHAPPAVAFFDEAAVSPADDAAARELSSAFDEFLGQDESVRGEPTRQAPDELSLDHVFRKTPIEGTQARGNGSVSFDDFFGREPRTSGSVRQQGGESGDQKGSDIETFQAWLEGLKK